MKRHLIFSIFAAFAALFSGGCDKDGQTDAEFLQGNWTVTGTTQTIGGTEVTPTYYMTSLVLGANREAKVTSQRGGEVSSITTNYTFGTMTEASFLLPPGSRYLSLELPVSWWGAGTVYFEIETLTAKRLVLSYTSINSVTALTTRVVFSFKKS